MNQTLEHPVLGRVIWNPETHSWEATVELRQDHWIAFCFEPSEARETDIQALMNHAAELLSQIRELEPQIRQKIADDLLDLYNNTWARDEDDDAPPRMSRAEFIQSITLESFNLAWDGSRSWWYNDNDLFAGHSIELWIDTEQSIADSTSTLVG
ncbi:DUF2262 domain-containing protein [Cyanobacteria bacterium FACHB-63]|nr:DUF2262 domain-containing protein [Cyanobacteria bacterium FACHB-63]